MHTLTIFMNNPLLRKLANFTALSEQESGAVEECCKCALEELSLFTADYLHLEQNADLL